MKINLFFYYSFIFNLSNSLNNIYLTSSSSSSSSKRQLTNSNSHNYNYNNYNYNNNNYNSHNSNNNNNNDNNNNNNLCFINGFSSNHYLLGLDYIYSIQKQYLCNKIYIYDLGLTLSQRAFLNSLKYLNLLKYTNNNKPYYQNGTSLFKPSLIRNFIKLYHLNLHQCKYFLYGHSNIILKKQFNELIFQDIQKYGIITELESKDLQYKVANYKTYQYFNYSYEDDKNSFNPILQVHSDALLVDSSNSTIYDQFLVEWETCVHDPNCLNASVHMINSHTLSAEHLHSNDNNHHSQIKHHSSVNVTKRISHLAEQSVFTFMMIKYFGRNLSSIFQSPLNDFITGGTHHHHNPRLHLSSSNSNSNSGSSHLHSSHHHNQVIHSYIHHNQSVIKEMSINCTAPKQKIILCSTCFV